jgi:hypothetical protein
MPKTATNPSSETTDTDTEKSQLENESAVDNEEGNDEEGKGDDYVDDPIARYENMHEGIQQERTVRLSID